MTKIALIFYSYSGNTKKAIDCIKDKLIFKKINVETIEIKPLVEERNFFKQCIDSFRKKTPQLSDSLKYDLSTFDYIIFASPIWALTITPSLRSYLTKVEGLKDKKTACFLTYGSGTGSQKALRELGDILKNKGANLAFSGSLSGFKTKNKSYLEDRLRPLLETLF